MTGDLELRAPRPRRWGKISADTDDRRFLAGPRPRLSELLWALRIFAEFIHGFRALHFVGPCVTVFGSARFSEQHTYYEMARRVGNAFFADPTFMNTDLFGHAAQKIVPVLKLPPTGS